MAKHKTAAKTCRLSELPFRRITARFDSAQTTPDNLRHWAAADYLAPDEEASPEVRGTLRRRSRYEIANNSYARGLVLTLANDTIGTGPRLQLLSSDESFNSRIERDFMRWSKAVNLASKLRTMRMSRCQDGESFAILSTNPKTAHEVKLNLCVIEADRISGDLNWHENDADVDGIHYDQWGNPVDYRVLKYHPGDHRYNPGEEALHIPAENMLHIFRQDRPELHRGIPELTSALTLFAQLRRYNLAVLSAAEAAADFAAVLYTDAPPDGMSQDVAPLDSIPLERNMMTTVPAGWKLGQIDPKQPAANHTEFVKVILREIARCVCCTFGTVAGDYSGYNYASGRLDNQIYHKSILVDRGLWEAEVLDRIFPLWLREYSLLHMLPPMEENHTWFWDGFPHVDPTKEASAQEKRLANHTSTLAAECAKDGRDWMEVVRQQAKEKQIMRELGLESVETGAETAPDLEESTEEEGVYHE